MPPEPLSTQEFASRCCFLVLAWIGVTAALFGIGQFIVHSHTITNVDRHITAWAVAHRTPALDSAMRAITWIGSWVATAVVGGIVLGLVLTKRLAPRALALFAVAWAGEYAAVNLIKYAVGRPRPPKDLWLVAAHGASFPSGHAANATLVCAVVVVVVFLCSPCRRARSSAVTLAVVACAAVACSRVELGVRWTTDVVAGCLVALAWLAAVAGLVATAVPLTVPRPPADRQERTGSPPGSPPGSTIGMR